ncbi:Protein CBG14246 [Caenorhabditis briggsae]|uniref:Protein CBG14246 n=2 Tax=Caenorhabditis briggsae TaxID=6238 RepID=A8XJL4_CAEBR|nr:Protein CBG14246 [Caenorhabditis briggsae]ULT81845.1 hypothetical protein L3Y34_011658 [Caenorhabditis briggsae]CAP32840.1 Protein CBG14246 [Caenorhabditis briggsae]
MSSAKSDSSERVEIDGMYILKVALIPLTLAASILFLYLYVKPIEQQSATMLVAPKSRDMRAEQIRMFALNEIVKANSHDLPPRSRNISAKALCKQKLACAPFNRRYETMIRVAPQYKMVNCVVQKSMSTMMTGAMCYLYNETQYEKSGRSFDDEFSGRLCKNQNEFSSVNSVRDAFNISYVKHDWTFSMVTRNPIDRFVSGYVDRCVRLALKNETQCNGCGLNMTCFIETEYKRLMEISYKRKTHRTMEDAHFFPQVWHCGLNEEFEFFEFIQYSGNAEDKMVPQLQDLLERQNVPEKSIEFIKNELIYKKSSHSTTGTPAKRFYYSRLMKSPYLLEFIVKMFYYDFLRFHYELPPGF